MKVKDMSSEQGLKVAKSVQQEIFEQQGYMILEEDILRVLTFFNSDVEGNVITGEEKSKGLFLSIKEANRALEITSSIKRNIEKENIATAHSLAMEIDRLLKSASR